LEDERGSSRPTENFGASGHQLSSRPPAADDAGAGSEGKGRLIAFLAVLFVLGALGGAYFTGALSF
jgi:hypothetical protein